MDSSDKTADWSINNNCEINFPSDRKPFDAQNKLKDFSKSFISGFSYLTFKLKKNQNSFAYNQETLTNWNLFDLLTLQDLEAYPKDVPVNLLANNSTYPVSEFNYPIELAVAKINETIIPITIIEAPYKIFLSPISPFLRPEKETDYRYQFSRDNSENKYYPHPRTQSKFKLTELWSNDLVFQITHPTKGITNLPPNFKIVAYEEVENITSAEITIDNSLFDGTGVINQVAQKSLTLTQEVVLKNNNGVQLKATINQWDFSSKKLTVSNFSGNLSKSFNLLFINQVEYIRIKKISFKTGTTNSNPDKDVFLLPDPNNYDRSNLAQLTNIKEFNRDVSSNYFNLSSLGVSTFLEYFNLDEKKFKVVGWKQDIKLGRDNYVELTEKAIDSRSTLKLLLSDISERRIEKGKSVLIYREYFKYLEKEKEFTEPLRFNNYLFKKIIALAEGSYFVSMEVDSTSVADRDNFLYSH
nr:hypothetical protein [Bacteroidota bacterium]